MRRATNNEPLTPPPWAASAPVPTTSPHRADAADARARGHLRRAAPTQKWPWVLGFWMIVLCCCGTGGFIIAHLGGQYPRKSTSPTRSPASPDQERGVPAAVVRRRSARSPASRALRVAVLEDAANPDQGVIFPSATRLIWDPKAELDNAVRLLDSDVRNPHDYPAGALEGHFARRRPTTRAVSVVVCAWIDHGSLGIGIFMATGRWTSAEVTGIARGPQARWVTGAAPGSLGWPPLRQAGRRGGSG